MQIILSHASRNYFWMIVMHLLACICLLVFILFNSFHLFLPTVSSFTYDFCTVLLHIRLQTSTKAIGITMETIQTALWCITLIYFIICEIRNIMNSYAHAENQHNEESSHDEENLCKTENSIILCDSMHPYKHLMSILLWSSSNCHFICNWTVHSCYWFF